MDGVLFLNRSDFTVITTSTLWHEIGSETEEFIDQSEALQIDPRVPMFLDNKCRTKNINTNCRRTH